MDKPAKPLYKPVKSTKQGKKMMVYVKGKNGNPKLIHFGDSNYKHNYKEYYTNEQRQKVADWFRLDIEYFGFKSLYY